MKKITRKRTAKEVKEESKKLLKNNNVESFTQDFNSLSLSTKRVKGQKINNKKHTNRQPIKRS